MEDIWLLSVASCPSVLESSNCLWEPTHLSSRWECGDGRLGPSDPSEPSMLWCRESYEPPEEVSPSSSHTSYMWEPCDREADLWEEGWRGIDRDILNSLHLTSVVLLWVLVLYIFVKLHVFMHFFCMLFYFTTLKMLKNRVQEHKSKPLPGILITVGLWAIRIKTIECSLYPCTKPALCNSPISYILLCLFYRWNYLSKEGVCPKLHTPWEAGPGLDTRSSYRST